MKLTGVADLPEIRPGDDIAALVAERAALEPGDVLTVASTIVSKAEGRTADLADYPVSGRAQEIADRIEAVAGEEDGQGRAPPSRCPRPPGRPPGCKAPPPGCPRGSLASKRTHDRSSRRYSP